MLYYIEIKLLHGAEISLGFLWKKVYTQVHLALVESNDNIGISIPKYKNECKSSSNSPSAERCLGDILRLFAATKEHLENLNLSKWFERLGDYIVISTILNVPDDIQEYASFYRKQVKTGKERHARRHAKRHNVTYEAALKRYEDMDEQVSKLPFVMLQSLSSSQELKLFIAKEEMQTPRQGIFNTFGLSKEATAPWF